MISKKITVGIQDYKKFREEGYFYIDKTPQIYNLLTNNQYYFISRPRRFGKSLTLSTIKYLYLGEKELFKDTWIYNNWDFETTYPVIFISFAGYTREQKIQEYISNNLTIFIDDKEYNLSDFTQKYSLSLLLKGIYKKTGKQTAVIIDEYDKGVLVNITNIKVAEEMRDFFTSFYAGVKDSDEYIKLFLLTGLTKVLKMSVFSVLNNLDDISYSHRFSDLMGFTAKEIEENYKEEIEEIADIKGFSYKKTVEQIKIYYNGYNFGNVKDTIYNPWNINKLALNKEFSYYWADTGIPSSILDSINKKQIDVHQLITRIKKDQLILSEIDFKLEDLHNINVAVLFANAGYLTIKKYEDHYYTLGYPNKETESVMLQFAQKTHASIGRKRSGKSMIKLG